MEKHILEKMKKTWIDLYNQGFSTAAVAKKCNVSPSRVYRYLDKEGLIRQNTSVTMKMVKEWIKLYQTGGESCASIGRQYNVSRSTVSNYLHKYGIRTSGHVPHEVG